MPELEHVWARGVLEDLRAHAFDQPYDIHPSQYVLVEHRFRGGEPELSRSMAVLRHEDVSREFLRGLGLRLISASPPSTSCHGPSKALGSATLWRTKLFFLTATIYS